jgi:hypothetical protein
MTVFGPQYPPGLQAVVNHAERFCALMARLEVEGIATHALGRAWLVGRTEEVETMLDCVVGDWRAGRLTSEAAEAAAAAYLQALHLGAHKRLALSPVLDCCEGEDAPTPLPLNEDALTRLLPLAAPNRDAGETYFDPRAVLEFLTEEVPLQPPATAGPAVGSAVGGSVRLGDKKT